MGRRQSDFCRGARESAAFARKPPLHPANPSERRRVACLESIGPFSSNRRPAVLNKLITRLRPAALAASAEDAAEAGLDALQLALVFRHFPIGARLTYFPEYRREFQFSTLILGYRINDYTLYSQEGIELGGSDVPRAFRIDEHIVVPLAKVEKLGLVLPDTSSHQRKLDYFTRAELGRDGQFRSGVTITLQARSLGRGVPTLDTLVDRKETLAAGPLAGHATVLVEPVLESMKVVDKRRRPRLAAAIDATLQSGEDGPGAVATPCRLVDFADDTLRLQAASGSLPTLKSNCVLAVQFAIRASGEVYRVRGKVLRQSDEGVVVRFVELFVPTDGAYRKIDTIDVLEIKTGLLNSRG